VGLGVSPRGPAELFAAIVQVERAFRLTLVRDTASAYFARHEAGDRIAIAEATVAGRPGGLRIAKPRLDAGVTSALGFRQAEILLAQAETALAARRKRQFANT